jgi:hypothetical protein
MREAAGIGAHCCAAIRSGKRSLVSGAPLNWHRKLTLSHERKRFCPSAKAPLHFDR